MVSEDSNRWHEVSERAKCGTGRVGGGGRGGSRWEGVARAVPRGYGIL